MKRFAAVVALLLLVGIADDRLTYGSPSPAPLVNENIFVNLAKKIVPSVVNISTYSTLKSPYGGVQGGNPDDLFRQFFEDFLRRHGQGDNGGEEDDETLPSPPPSDAPKVLPRAVSLGSGFIIDSSGLILTNNHVVAGADEIKVTFTEEADEEPISGEVVGRDTEIDVALIRVKTKRKLTPVALGDSEALEVGEYVIAVGNPFGQGHSVTHGIISAKGRLAPEFPLATYLQTDAPINPGNSGGPLVNLKGEVIGINNAIQQRAQGIGFAIPINLVKKVLPQLRTKGTVEYGFIGVMVHEMDPEYAEHIGVPKDLHSPFVTQVIPHEPADKAGVQPFDIITQFNGKPIHSYNDLVNEVASVPVGTSVALQVNRVAPETHDKKTLNLTITVAKRKNPEQLTNGEGTQAKKNKKKPQAKHIDAGMELEDLTPETARDLGLPEKTKGVVVSSVVYGGAADQSGLARGDVLVGVNRTPIQSVNDFYSIVKDKTSYLVRFRRTDGHGTDIYNVIMLNLKG